MYLDEITPSRTSAHSWCGDECYNDETVALIRKRIFDVTSIPEQNFEHLQLLKYETGQYYWSHNDFIEYHNEQSHGPRLLTFFMYFNEVEEGGATRFPHLDLTIHPKKGRVLIWPSIKDDENWSLDDRTDHEAMEVKKGRKFAGQFFNTSHFQFVNRLFLATMHTYSNLFVFCHISLHILKRTPGCT